MIIMSQLFVTVPESFDLLVIVMKNIGEDNLKFEIVRERLLLAKDVRKNDKLTQTHHEKSAAFQGSTNRNLPENVIVVK